MELFDSAPVRKPIITSVSYSSVVRGIRLSVSTERSVVILLPFERTTVCNARGKMIA